MVPEFIEVIRADPEIAALLPVDDLTGRAAVYAYWAPDSRQPYVVITHDAGAVGNMSGTVEDGQAELNIWDEGSSLARIRRIASRVVDLLDYTDMETDRGPVRVKLRNSGALQEPTPDTVRWRLTFGTRMLREAATTARANRGTTSLTLVNINTASASDLTMLPRVSPGAASSIEQYRIDNGPFAAIENVLEVNGVGRKTFDAIKGLITV